MKACLPCRCVIAFGIIVSTTLAQTPPVPPAVDAEAQKFLDAPVWYLNYTVTTKLSGSQGSRTESSERVGSGTMTLGLRSQGPSLSIISGEAKPPDLISQIAAQQAQALAALGANANPQALAAAAALGLPAVSGAQVDQANAQFDAFIYHYANWISGVNLDDTKSDAENERILVQVREQNNQAFERYRWQYSDPDGRSRGSASGSGTTLMYDEPAFEINGAKRTFKLLFQLFFTDSPQTVQAFRGVEEHGIGTEDYRRDEIKTGLHSGEQPITSITPAYKIDGVLPSGFGVISGQSIHSIIKGGLPGTLSVQYSLSPYPRVPVELIIEPPADYVRWQPLGHDDEKTAGDTIPINVTLQKIGGGPPPIRPLRFSYYLLKTSRELGVCLNWPPNPDASLPYDLQFEQSANRGLVVIGPERQEAVNTVPTSYTDTVVVSSFDFGAHGELAVTAELENGQLVHGIVKNTASQRELMLPFRQPGSIIASQFFDSHGLSGVQDDDDTERDPAGDGFTGDGLTLYEEYRGFWVGDSWTAGDPKKKEVFVMNELRGLPSTVRGIRLFESVTSFKVHDLLRENQVDGSGQINFLRTSGPHVVDQHAILIQPGDLVVLGNQIAQVTGDVGTPGTAKTVSIPPDLGIQLGAGYMASTLAHEMLHACNVYHHGENDRTVWWSYSPPGTQFYESDAVWDPAQGTLIDGRNHAPITVRKEDGSIVIPAQFFPAGKTGGPIGMGMAHGQHSGDEQCIMRYDVSMAYRSNRTAGLRYLSGRETTGFSLCTSPAGTGVNDAGRTTPEPRYLTAATPQNGGSGVIARRGDCIHQLRVNDLATEPKR